MSEMYDAAKRVKRLKKSQKKQQIKLESYSITDEQLDKMLTKPLKLELIDAWNRFEKDFEPVTSRGKECYDRLSDAIDFLLKKRQGKEQKESNDVKLLKHLLKQNIYDLDSCLIDFLKSCH